MLRPDPDLIRVVHAERLERDLAAAARSRRRAAAMPSPKRSIRRPVGRLLCRLGAWVAADRVLLPSSARAAGMSESGT